MKSHTRSSPRPFRKEQGRIVDKVYNFEVLKTANKTEIAKPSRPCLI
jgi:hypothetical protein